MCFRMVLRWCGGWLRALRRGFRRVCFLWGCRGGGGGVWGVVAGATAGIALACFYVALSRGAMGASAALSGLLAAAIPAAVSAGIEGAPGLMRLGGVPGGGAGGRGV